MRRIATLSGLLLLLAAMPVRAEVILQYFQTGWDEIYRRLPEIGEVGYEGLWLPPPCKSPVGGGLYAGGGNVGYSLFDRFDIGDVPQRGSLATAYGTRGSLRNLADNAHQSDVKIYPDIVFNHSGNGADYRTYPGTAPNDYHGWWDATQPGGFKRPPRMSNYGEINGGYGRAFQEELVSLFDLALESDQRFSTASPFYAAWPAPYIRQPGWNERYPFNGGTNVTENVVQFMYRWINWLGYAMDYDGVRLDAPKHCIADFLGLPGYGFNHEVQWNYQIRRGYSTSDEYSDLYKNYLRRKNALIFGEFFIGGIGEVDYWRQFGGQGVKMRYLDFPRKSGMIFPAFNGNNLAALSSLGTGFSEAEGVLFCQSHDESPPSKLELAYAYTLTHIGLPVVYFTGNNLSEGDVNVKTWLKIGHGGALGDYNNVLPNLVYIHNQFARGREWERWSDGGFYAYERFEDVNNSDPNNANPPEAGESLLLVALNGSGWDQTRTLYTGFANGTVLHDYAGHNSADVTVSGGQATVSVPGGINGQGWVCYAPYNASANGEPIRFSSGGIPAGTMNWIVPGGTLATNKPRQVVRLTNDTADVDVYFTNPQGGTADNVLVKWGQGRDLNPAAADYTGSDLVSGGFEQATQLEAGHWRLAAALTNVPEGVHLIKARVFNQRPTGYPALFQTFAKSVYVDRHGPDLQVITPAEGATVPGNLAAVVTNGNRTAYAMDFSIDGGATNAAYEVMKGLWKFALPALTAGSHTLTVRALEADWGEPRQLIDTSVVVRTFTVDTSGPAVDLNWTNGAVITLPFFQTTITTPGLDASNVKLYWDGFQMAGLQGSGTIRHTFDGRYVSGGVTQRLWGAFVNGPHFFEAVAVNGGQTNRVARQVVFNLYGRNDIDSDGDGLPDNVEMPNFSTGTAPGPNQQWPGDSSWDMIPNYGESWSRLNPMNAETFYSGVWDGDLDSDGDGFSNLAEVRQGFLEHGDPYYYNIYDAGSHPDGLPPVTVSKVLWTPATAVRGSPLNITYEPHDGALSGATSVVIHMGHSLKTTGYWQGAMDVSMTPSGSNWVYSYTVPAGATSVEFSFTDGAGTWDNNSGKDWHATVQGDGPSSAFTMDGDFDGANGGDGYTVFSDNMKILAAVNSNTFYVATWSTEASDVFVYVTDQPGDAMAAPWAKAGSVFFDTARKPYLAAESGSGRGAWLNNVSGSVTNGVRPSHPALEAKFNLVDVFGYVPEAVYIAAVAYGTADSGSITSQSPYAWSADNNVDPTEFLRVPIASIRDENLDGYFDAGKPQMWTVVGASTNDANYGLRRFFINELAGESQTLTVILKPNVAPGSILSNVELLSNLNRRDFAVMEEDPATIATGSTTNYYRAYAMTANGDGTYSFTLSVRKCGAYRINARYRVNGGSYVYYTDHGLRRDCAVVVSPRKALDLNIYEMNPMVAEATNDTFYGRSTFRDMIVANTNRPDFINTNHFTGLGVNMIWLQPIHPIGSEGRETDPSTGLPYDPGSPYAVRNYWKVNSALGDPATEAEAMQEFTNFVQAMDGIGVGVMLDGTFNHSAWDCELGEKGAALFPAITTNPAALIREVRPQWYSRAGDYGSHATHYAGASDHDIATAPDRMDFGKWSDAADFFFGRYDALVQGVPADPSNTWSCAWASRFLFEEDRIEPLDGYTRELWEYFAAYPLYWLEKTGHPAGTPADQSYLGIDGLRCDFAQGLPSAFWEYCINKTRTVKWDFIFMAESLDGYKTVNGSNRHGVGYRSSRHFDVLNENITFYWRNNFFAYPYQGAGGDNWGSTPQPYTYPTWQAFDERRNAYDVSPLLLNLSAHDEVYPSHDPYRLLYAYAELDAMDGVPMMLFGQEIGVRNNHAVYNFSGEIPDSNHNFDRYETNFGKSIPHFKRYNSMINAWNHRDGTLQDLYARMNRARRQSAALRSQGAYFLSRTGGTGYDPDMFAVAKYEAPGVSAATQNVVFAFVNNNYWGSENRWSTFDLSADYGGRNRFGIERGHNYNMVDLLSTNPAAFVWGANRSGDDLLSAGITVGLTRPALQGGQAQYLKLIDVGSSYPDTDGDGVPDYSDWDSDNDGLPDWWEKLYGLNPLSAAGDDGADGDRDHDGIPNYEEFLAGTRPDVAGDLLRIHALRFDGTNLQVRWPAVPDRNYAVESVPKVGSNMPPWIRVTALRTALSNEEEHTETISPATSNRFYRVIVEP